MIEISVIIPIFNTEKYVVECLDSVIDSTIFQYCEVICIDDGSEDQSSKFILPYTIKYSNIYLYSYPHEGVSMARNHGICKASGRYIFFLDSDDFIDSTYLEKLYKAILEYDCEVVFAGFSRTKGKNGMKEPLIRQHLSISNVMDGCKYLEQRLDNEDWENQVWCALYDSHFLKQYHLYFNKDIKVYEDILFTNLVLMFASKVYMIPEYGYMYRVRSGSLVQREYYIEEVHSCLKILECFNYYYPKLSNKKKCVLGRAYIHVVSMLLYRIGEIDPPDKKKYYKELDRLKVLEKMKYSASSPKEKMKCIIFCLNWGLFYKLVRK